MFNNASSGTLFLPAGDQLRMLDTDSTTALQIADYHGNPFVDFDSINHQVGIGTSSLLATPHLDQGGTQSQDTLLIGNDTTKGLQLRDTGSALDLESIGVALFVNSTTQQPIYLNPSGGNVGIGTNNPQVVLDVNGDVRSDAALQVFRDVDGTVPNRPDQIYLQGVSNPNLKMYVGFDTTNQVGLIQALEEGVAWRNISFVRDGGNVLIGTTSPGNKLTVSTALTDDGVTIFGANSQDVVLLTNLGNSAYNSSLSRTIEA